MKYILNYYTNLNFRKKITILCLIVSIIPVILIGSFCYTQVRSLLIQRENTALQETLEQEIRNLDYKLESFEYSINNIVWDEKIRNSLMQTYNNNYEMYSLYKDILDPLFRTIRTTHKEITTITLYTDNPIYPHGTTLRPLSDISSEKWYDEALSKTSPIFITSDTNKTLLLVCQIYLGNSKYTNIIYMKLDYGKTFESLYSLFENSYGIYIIDNKEQSIFSYHDNYADINLDDSRPTQDIAKNLKDGTIGNSYVYKKVALSTLPWNAYLYRPIHTISAAANRITLTVFIVIILCLGIIFLISFLLSKIVVKPLEALSKNMAAVENGEFTVTVKYSSNDEIGHLIYSFHHMVEQIQYMINEVFKSKIAQQEYEMKALQAQINPHFLYNSLSLINGKAIMSEQEEISQMAQLLSTFYRTTLNKGKNIISVRDELENTRSYTSIQCMMHSNSFDVTYNIDESALSYTMINLLLQPLVENAIIHGIDHKENSGRGKLAISCLLETDFIIFTVEDNGCGISQENIDSLLTTDTNGYGIKNVHHRVQLFYGEQYGLQYKSTINEGTCVKLIIPRSV